MTRNEAKQRDPGALLDVASVLCSVFGATFDAAVALVQKHGNAILADPRVLSGATEGLAFDVLHETIGVPPVARKPEDPQFIHP